eukprot:TRINITY_DN2843_c0_g1_i1.p1 TRINITY_DN2843_c0_g1~~TRINITY_DN2843_c0_g1_i1.p1  ORF type:complete len:205 (-),score=69.69 TRINITY_DN2843_c0_g1_i1:47-661(-)
MVEPSKEEVEDLNRPKIEEISDDEDEDSEDDDDIPALEQVKPTENKTSTTNTTTTTTDAAKGEEEGASRQSRTEKKARKQMQKLGMQKVPGVMRITVKKNKSNLFVINKPDVFKAPGSDTYVIFGEAREDTIDKLPDLPVANPPYKEKPAPVFNEPEEDVDETGVEPKDIELVMSQTGASRRAAVAALKKNNNDIVNAIMDLTM